jgi:UDP-4-amino-4,6-dideoxy-N-acetyl-beta-L-altrosamine transaminase
MSDAPFLPYARQTLDDADVAAVLEVLRGDWLTTGPKVAQFEAALARAGGARHAVAVSSGTAALHAAYAALGLGPGDELVTSPLTFVATAHAALALGARVRFADVDPGTGLLAPAAAAAAVSARTRVLVPVDYAGQPADYGALRALAEERGLALVADAAHSFGARWRGEPVGSLADVSVTSFHPVKAITSAEGGALLTDDDALARRAARFRNHGIERDPARLTDPDPGAWHVEVHELGLNYRLPDVLCALGLSQLDKLERFVARRRAIAAVYGAALAGVPGLELPATADGVLSSWHLYVVRVRDARRRRALFERLRGDGLGVQVHYEPVHLQPFYRARGHRPGECPVAEDFAARALSLPLYPALSERDVQRVIETVCAAARALL